LPPLTPEQARTRAALASHESWARTADRAARTAPAREARRAKYLERARELQGPDATPEAVERAADHLYRADMARMSLKAAQARARKAGGAGDDRAA
jgi:hypothetical protein